MTTSCLLAGTRLLRACGLPVLALCFLLLVGAACAQIPATPATAPAQTPTTAPVTGTAIPATDTGTAGITSDQALLYPPTPDQLLAAGDQISIRLFSDSEYSFTGRIAVDGTVLLPLLGIVPLQGLSITQAEQMIAQRLEAAGMYRDPQVILQLTEGPNAIITLGGDMHATVPAVGSRTLYSVIATGGGLPSTASRTVQILRPGHAEPISVVLGTDPARERGGLVPVFPGDTVLVSHLGVIYVAGEFRNPGVVQMTNYTPLTLTQISAMVGGPQWDARYNSLHIIRTVGDHRTVTTLNIKDVLYGKKPDPIMEPNDIVFLPPSPIKSSLSNGSLGSVLGLLSFALATFYTLR